MKLIFLDVDGVLNSDAYFKRDPRGMVFGFSDAELLNHFDQEACARLEKIIVATRAKLIFSSSWRQMIDTSEAKRILAAKGCPSAEFVGETPKRWREAFEPHMRNATPWVSQRGAEILEWLAQNWAAKPGGDVPWVILSITRRWFDFVILDDSLAGAVLEPRQVRTAFETGLLDEHVTQAIGLLSMREGE